MEREVKSAWQVGHKLEEQEKVTNMDYIEAVISTKDYPGYHHR